MHLLQVLINGILPLSVEILESRLKAISLCDMSHGSLAKPLAVNAASSLALGTRDLQSHGLNGLPLRFVNGGVTLVFEALNAVALVGEKVLLIRALIVLMQDLPEGGNA
jgi:hypothetical protein